MENIIHFLGDETCFFPHFPPFSHLPPPHQKCISKCPYLGVQCGKKESTRGYDVISQSAVA